MNKTIFLIDGFNLYHSILDAVKQNKLPSSCKWLNLKSLCNSYLHLIGNNAQIADIFYFTSYTKHFKDKIKRHKTFVKALKSVGIKIVFGKFKKRHIMCKHCKIPFDRYEEKETDVAIAVKIMELGHIDCCDTIVVISGDTDLSPAVRTFKKLFSNKEVYFIFPYHRKNQELKDISENKSFNISFKQYQNHQFPDRLMTKKETINKPSKW